MEKRKYSTIGVDLIRLGSWKGNGLTSQRSIARFDRSYGHIGNEIPQVVYLPAVENIGQCSQE